MQPVFIGGCPRSGTTLLGASLGEHPLCLTTPESLFKIDLLRALSRGQIPADSHGVRNYLRGNWRFRLWEIEPDYHLEADLDPECIVRNVLKQAIQCYAEKTGASDYSHWVDHTPSNFRWLSSLRTVFPEAKYIHLIRDPRGVASSVIPLDWGPNTAISAARWWLSELAYGQMAESSLPDEVIIRIRYEDLLAQPEQTLRRLTTFLGLEYFPTMQDTSRYDVHDYSRKQHNLVGQRFDLSRSSAWRCRLKPRQREIIEYFVGDVLPLLGYESEYGLSARHPGWLEQINSQAVELFRVSWNKIRHRSRRISKIGRQ
jgi:hypothetical protein